MDGYDTVVDDDLLVASLSSRVSMVISLMSELPYNSVNTLTVILDCLTDIHSTDVTFHIDDLLEHQSSSTSITTTNNINSDTANDIASSPMISIHKADGWWHADNIPLRALLPSAIWNGTDGYIGIPSLISLIRDYAHTPTSASTLTTTTASSPPMIPLTTSSTGSNIPTHDDQWRWPIAPLSILPRGYVHVQLSPPLTTLSSSNDSNNGNGIDDINDVNEVLPLSTFTDAVRTLLKRCSQPTPAIT
jgi:hypothetical protein